MTGGRRSHAKAENSPGFSLQAMRSKFASNPRSSQAEAQSCPFRVNLLLKEGHCGVGAVPAGEWLWVGQAWVVEGLMAKAASSMARGISTVCAWKLVCFGMAVNAIESSRTSIFSHSMAAIWLGNPCKLSGRQATSWSSIGNSRHQSPTRSVDYPSSYM